MLRVWFGDRKFYMQEKNATEIKKIAKGIKWK